MLQKIRERAQGLVAMIIVGLIIITFALWGVESYITAGRQVVVAEAEGDEILLSDFQDQLQRLRRQAQSMFGDRFDVDEWNTPEVKEKALEQLIDDRLLERLVDDARIRISNRQVAEQLAEIPAFQDDNGFSRALYEQRVPQLGMSQAGFEAELRSDMAKAQLRAGISGSEFVLREEAQRVEQLTQQTRDVGYAIIPAGQFEEESGPSDSEAAEFFENHREDYRTPEMVKLEYLEISAPDLESEVSVDEEALREFFDANQTLYTAAEERNVNHILINLDPSADDEAQAAALAKAESALERARAGEEFEALAKELSDDVGSSTEGGETGMFQRGVMAPEFEAAAFALAVGEISEPVKTRFGYHIIKLKAVNAGGLKPFEEVRDAVEAAYRSSEAQKAFFDLAEQFSSLVYEHPDSLNVAAESLNLEIRQTDRLTREGLTALFSEKLAKRAFEPEVLLEGLNAEPVGLDDGRVVAIRVLEHSPAAIPTLAEVRETVVADAAQARRRELTEAEGKSMIEQLQAGAEVAGVVESKGLGWESKSTVRRDSNDVNRAVLRAAFQTPLAAGDAPKFIGVPIGKEDYAIIRIANATIPVPGDIDTADVLARQKTLLPGRVRGSWQEFLGSLRSASDVRVYSQNL